jgi:hypothetical protein
MRHTIALFAILSLTTFGACASSQQGSGPPVSVRIAPLDTASDLFYFRGPIGLRYGVEVSNPSNEPVTLRRLDLHSAGGGAYALRANSTPLKVQVPPGAAKTFSISTWGRARGGYLNAGEPVILQGTAYFDSPKGPFVKLFQENVQTYP